MYAIYIKKDNGKEIIEMAIEYSQIPNIIAKHIMLKKTLFLNESQYSKSERGIDGRYYFQKV